MIEQFKISSFEEIIITARISKSGDPIAQNGDIESLPIITKNTNRSEIELVISNLIN